ncbi:hypothetical protein TL16_g10090 [Triparma laevis f. inornata]|uniref:Bacterial bifunctional deaminase-reductase C-terminal domain-containing protein n=1 Tax=Triparma laevis f. inornata TaxID=1714386 RepID=A0A9W7ELA4_9STRA|nr:hypothetical protein TL16_g10090 [Triparma laevis f. inornata]
MRSIATLTPRSLHLNVLRKLRWLLVLLLLIPSFSSGYCVLKLALDKNGLIGSTSTSPNKISATFKGPRSNSNPNNFRFTSPSSLDLVHRLRARCDFVITGSNTVIQDNPSFSCRRGVEYTRNPNRNPDRGEQNGPTRVVVDRGLKLLQWELTNAPQTLNLLHPTPPSAPTILYHLSNSSSHFSSPLNFVTLSGLPTTSSSLPDSILGSLSKTFAKTSPHPPQIMLEGGGNLARSFVESNLVTHAIIVQSPNSVFPKIEEGGVDGFVGRERKGLLDHGFVKLGEYDSEGDVVECWVKEGEKWPDDELKKWP